MKFRIIVLIVSFVAAGAYGYEIGKHVSDLWVCLIAAAAGSYGIDCVGRDLVSVVTFLRQRSETGK